MKCWGSTWGSTPNQVVGLNSGVFSLALGRVRFFPVRTSIESKLLAATLLCSSGHRDGKMLGF